jgi:glycosyltransferase involved in cell wall biosynthesis
MTRVVTLPEVAVIMPTLGSPERAPLLRRALHSVLSQDGVRPVPVVVLNGPGIDAALLEDMRADSRVRPLVLERADLPAALLAGRKRVQEPWFAELDDDDELVPGALALRVRALESRPECGAVVTNGIRRGSNGDSVHLSDVQAVAADPLRSLFSKNWLLPGSWLCRTDAVSDSVFAGMPSYLECTYLAVRFASVTQLAFLAEPTVVYHEDTPLSESKTPNYVLGQEAAFRRILELELPPDVRRLFELRLAPASWAAATVLAEGGDPRGAWARRLGALSYPGGWRLASAIPRQLWPKMRR